MRKRLRRAIALSTSVIACAFSPVTTLAQPSVASPPGTSSPTTFIPATVQDRQGNVVTGLGRDDFAVRDGDRTMPIVSWSAESGPIGLVLVIDASGSVGETEAAHAHDLIQRLLDAAQPGSEFFVVGIAGRVWPGMWTEDRRDVTSALDELTRRRRAAQRDLSGLPTPLFDGILGGMMAAEQSRHRNRAVIIVSDGEDTRSQAIVNDVEAAMRRSPALVYSLRFESTYPRGLALPMRTSPDILRRYVEETGGRAFNVRNAGDWTAAADRIAADLQHVYVIGVQPDVSRRGWRRVTVAVTSTPGQELTVRSRRGYLVPRR